MIQCFIVSVTNIKKGEELIMEKWICTVCGYVYDPAENGGVAFEDLPDDYTCPLCSASKDHFEKDED